MAARAPEIVRMFGAGPRIADFDFSETDALASGETITAASGEAVSPVTVPPLAVDSVTVAPDALGVQLVLSGGLADTVYVVSIDATTSENQVLPVEGIVRREA